MKRRCSSSRCSRRSSPVGRPGTLAWRGSAALSPCRWSFSSPPSTVAQALEALHLHVLAAGILLQALLQLCVIPDVSALAAADDHFIERRLRQVNVPRIDQRLHVAEEEGQQQRPDVSPVNIRICHYYN